ncbi:MAG: tetratricopeptide repeat protein [Sandaracinus sp.]
MRYRSRAWVLALVLSCVGLAPRPAQAQSVDAADLETEARARFQLGQLYYSQGRFEEAAREFEAAYASHPHPVLLHNLYLARRDAGDARGAIDALTQYLATATDLSASDRRVLERRVEVMREQIQRAAPTETTTTQTTAPIEPTETSPEEATPEQTPAEETTTDAASTLPPPEPAPPSSDADALVTGAIASFGVAGAAALTMAITGGLALSERDRLASSCAPACTDDQISGARTLGIVADVSLGIGAAAAVAGIVLVVLGTTGRQEGVSVAPSVSTDHAGLVVGGQF